MSEKTTEITGIVGKFSDVFNPRTNSSETVFTFYPDDSKNYVPLNLPLSAFNSDDGMSNYIPHEGDHIQVQMIANSNNQPIPFDLDTLNHASQDVEHAPKQRTGSIINTDEDNTSDKKHKSISSVLKSAEEEKKKQHYDPKQAAQGDNYNFAQFDPYANNNSDTNSEEDQQQENTQSDIKSDEDKQDNKKQELSPETVIKSVKSDHLVVGIAGILAGILKAMNCFVGIASLPFNLIANLLLAFTMVYSMIALVRTKKYGHKFAVLDLFIFLESLSLIVISVPVATPMINYSIMGSAMMLTILSIFDMLHKAGIKSVQEQQMIDAAKQEKVQAKTESK